MTSRLGRYNIYTTINKQSMAKARFYSQEVELAYPQNILAQLILIFYSLNNERISTSKALRQDIKCI